MGVLISDAKYLGKDFSNTNKILTNIHLTESVTPQIHSGKKILTNIFLTLSKIPLTFTFQTGKYFWPAVVAKPKHHSSHDAFIHSKTLHEKHHFHLCMYSCTSKYFFKIICTNHCMQAVRNEKH